MIPFEKFSQDSRRLILIVVCILVESLQLLVIATVISNYFPVQEKDFLAQNFTERAHDLLLNRQVDLYRLFVFANVLLGIVFVRFGIIRAKDHRGTQGLALYVLFQSGVLALQSFAAFKMFVYKSPGWASFLLWAAITMGILSHIFWPELRKAIGYVYENWFKKGFNRIGLIRFDIAVIITIVVCLYIPDLEKALAHVFLWDRFINWDRFLMAPAWAHLHAVKLNVDAGSPWGSVAPMVMAWLAQISGGFDYAHVLWWSVALTILYFIFSYFLLRFWLNSALLAFGGVLLAIKLHLFNAGTAPLVWLYPQKTVLRYLPDLFVILFLLLYNQRGNPRMLLAAAVGTGFCLLHMPDTGLAMLMAFYSHLIFLMTHRKLRQPWLFLLPWGIALIVLGLVQGTSLFDIHFWQKTFEPITFLCGGLNAVPFYACLRDYQFFGFVMEFIIPGVYVATILVVGALCYSGKIRWQNFLVATISIYGLGLYPYFLWQSSLDNYYAVGIPFVFVICYWIHLILKLLSPIKRRLFLTGWVVLNLGALLTNQLFIYYPNMLNIASFDWSGEKKLYHDNFNFDKDAALIQEHTAADEPVVLISSFETPILMAAHRKSFFYRTPLIESVHMGMPQFVGTYIYTIPEFQSIIQQLDRSKPDRVFVEGKLILGRLPKGYYQYYQSLTALLLYIQQHYQLEAQGQYLLELKRK